MKSKKHDEDIDLLEQIVNLADQKNLYEIEFQKKYKDDTEIFIKVLSSSKDLIIKEKDNNKIVQSPKQPSEKLTLNESEDVSQTSIQLGDQCRLHSS